MQSKTETGERFLAFTIEVDAPRGDVWDAWTTETGTQSFFAPASNVEPRPGGKYEMLWDLEADYGNQGSEGNIVLGVSHRTMFSFTWNSPTEFDEIRDQRTVVILRFSDVDGETTQVNLTHIGWGEGAQWDAAFEYFEEAWGDVVLPNLQERFNQGPVFSG